MLRSVCMLAGCAAVGSAASAAGRPEAAATVVECDIVVAGGSLASLAAAVTAANNTAATVCFTDPTTQPGGQLTASGVPAVDFGPDNRNEPRNIAASFRAFLYGSLMPGQTNLGDCWVSTKCFEPQLALDHFIFPLLAHFPNLKTYLMTTVTGTTRDATGRVTAVSALRRTPAAGTTGWEQLSSAMIEDWYNPATSAAFPVKEQLTLVVKPGGIVIEATEFGDVLMTGGMPVAQGAEFPLENSTTYQSYCGQGTTIPWYLAYGTTNAPSPDPVPAGQCGADPTNCVAYTMQDMSWNRNWMYRRVVGLPGGGSGPVQGETSVINVGGGNDESEAYLFLPLDSPELQAQLATPGAWRGGLNVTAYQLAENRSLAFYHWLKANATDAVRPYLSMNATLAGTSVGLTQMPYLRDTRRSAAGLDGFRIFYKDLHVPDPRLGNRTAYRWDDTVSIGQYFYADIHKMTNTSCPYPSYIVSGASVLPYFIPWRALTVQTAPNVLVAGKSISSTFQANAAIRLHPEEWTTGAAAGAAAALMVQQGWDDTATVLTNIAQLQTLLVSPRVGVPLNWTLPPTDM